MGMKASVKRMLPGNISGVQNIEKRLSEANGHKGISEPFHSIFHLKSNGRTPSLNPMNKFIRLDMLVMTTSI